MAVSIKPRNAIKQSVLACHLHRHQVNARRLNNSSKSGRTLQGARKPSRSWREMDNLTMRRPNAAKDESSHGEVQPTAPGATPQMLPERKGGSNWDAWAAALGIGLVIGVSAMVLLTLLAALESTTWGTVLTVSGILGSGLYALWSLFVNVEARAMFTTAAWGPPAAFGTALGAASLWLWDRVIRDMAKNTVASHHVPYWAMVLAWTAMAGAAAYAMWRLLFRSKVPWAVWAGTIGLGLVTSALVYGLYNITLVSAAAIEVWGPLAAVGLFLGWKLSERLYDFSCACLG